MIDSQDRSPYTWMERALHHHIRICECQCQVGCSGKFCIALNFAKDVAHQRRAIPVFETVLTAKTGWYELRAYLPTMPRISSTTSKRISLWLCRTPDLRHGIGDVKAPPTPFEPKEPMSPRGC
jgi:hypothetical protein